MSKKRNFSTVSLSGLKEHWQSDLTASLSVALVALPLGLGIATAAGVTPIAGVISAIAGGVLTSWIRGSHVGINGPGNGLIVVIITALAILDDGKGQTYNYLLAAFILSGVFTTIIGFLKLGKLGELFPTTVVYGMMAGIGVIIVGSQFHSATGNVSDNPSQIGFLLDIPKSIINTNPIVLFLAVGSLLMLIFHDRATGAIFHFIPGPVWALAFALPFVYIFNFFGSHDVWIFDHPYHIGPEFLVQVPDNLFGGIPTPNFERIGDFSFWNVVFGLTFVSALETTVSARASEKLDPAKREVNLNRELIGTGLASIASAFVGGIPVMTVVARSSVNVFHGAKTTWSNIFHGLILVVLMLFCLPLIADIPKAALSAILLFVGYKLFAIPVWKNIWQIGKEQMLIFIVSLLATLLMGLAYGVVIGSAFTFIIHLLFAKKGITKFLKKQIRPKFKLRQESEDKYVLKLKGVLNFLTLPKIKSIVSTIPDGKDFMINFTTSPIIDHTVMEYLRNFRTHYQTTGGNMHFLGLSRYQASVDHPEGLRILSKNPIPKDKLKRLTSRQKELKRISKLKSWKFHPHPCWEWGLLEPFEFFKVRPIVAKHNVITGTIDEHDVTWEIADITFDEGALLASDQHDLTCHVLELPFELPPFIIKEENFLDRIVHYYDDVPDKDFQMEEFSEHLTIQTPDHMDIDKYVNPKLHDFLNFEKIHHLECSGSTLMYFSEIRLAQPEEIAGMVRFAEELVPYLHQ